MKTIEIKGKQYITVAERLLYIADHEVHEIETEPTFYENQQMWVVKATLTLHREGGHFKFTGHAQEIIGDGYINKTSALENAETSAVGRACAMAGIGIIESIASVDEINKANARETYKPKEQNFAAMTPQKQTLSESVFAKILARASEPGLWEKVENAFQLTTQQATRLNFEINKANDNKKNLTYEDLATDYKNATGQSALTKDLDYVFNWAAKQPDKYTVTNEGTIIRKENKQ